MSQYINISIKNKDDKNISVNLAWRSTTMARHLSNVGAFPYSSDDILLTEKDYFSYLDIIKQEIDEQKKRLEYRQSKLKASQLNLPLATCREVYDTIKQEIDDNEVFIEEITADIEEYSDLYNELRHVWEIYQDNVDKWNLYYYNC